MFVPCSSQQTFANPWKTCPEFFPRTSSQGFDFLNPNLFFISGDYFNNLNIMIHSLLAIKMLTVEAKLDFENYRGNELEVGHFGPTIEAGKD
jgi:hypothetical protein